jgi:hypothetical protein
VVLIFFALGFRNKEADTRQVAVAETTAVKA